MKPMPVTPEQLNAWSRNYQASPERQLATLALSKTDLYDVSFVSKAAFAMRRSGSL